MNNIFKKIPKITNLYIPVSDLLCYWVLRRRQCRHKSSIKPLIFALFSFTLDPASLGAIFHLVLFLVWKRMATPPLHPSHHPTYSFSLNRLVKCTSSTYATFEFRSLLWRNAAKLGVNLTWVVIAWLRKTFGWEVIARLQSLLTQKFCLTRAVTTVLSLLRPALRGFVAGKKSYNYRLSTWYPAPFMLNSE